jgi:hypothetical protein
LIESMEVISSIWCQAYISLHMLIWHTIFELIC